ALLVSEYQQKAGIAQEAIRADRDAAPEFLGEVDLGVGQLTDEDVEHMLAQLGEGSEQRA
ncbi:MAG TPA: hypothetical protein VK358_12585, partial [Longimicrobium sp.]|nr:hypothetical protein [Longimicrobium sp.]